TRRPAVGPADRTYRATRNPAVTAGETARNSPRWLPGAFSLTAVGVASRIVAWRRGPGRFDGRNRPDSRAAPPNSGTDFRAKRCQNFVEGTTSPFPVLGHPEKKSKKPRALRPSNCVAFHRGLPSSEPELGQPPGGRTEGQRPQGSGNHPHSFWERSR